MGFGARAGAPIMTASLLINTISEQAMALARHDLDRMLRDDSRPVQGDVRALGAAERHRPFFEFINMLSLAAEQSRRAELGLDLAERADISGGSVFGDLFSYAPTLGDALEALASYFAACQTGTRVAVGRSGGLVHVSYEVHGERAADSIHDGAYTLGKLLLSIRHSVGRSWSPEQVTFTAPAPAEQFRYRGFFAAPVTFGAYLCALHFTPDVLGRPVAGAQIVRFREFCARLRAESGVAPAPPRLEETLRAWIRGAMAEGTADLGEAAQRLGVTPRTLQRRLRAEGIGFQDVLNDVRMEEAVRALRAGTCEVGDIAHRLGFSETSVFTRTFRRHYGQTPTAFRQDASAG